MASSSHAGNTALPFADLIELEKVDERTFRSIARPISPGGQTGGGRAYGGHVYMQASWAACQTVAPGFLLHNVSGNFLLGGLTIIPFVYKVHIIRDGRSYATRIVNVTQAEGKGICFTCICSFKLPEVSPMDSQERMDLWARYESALGGKTPSDLKDAGMDAPEYLNGTLATDRNEAFPGLQVRKPDMAVYNRKKHPIDRRTLILYRTLGVLPPDDNMHLCAHLYASDFHSLFHVADHFDIRDVYTQIGSLVHSVTFHSGMEDLTFGSSTRNDSPLDDESGKWYCKVDSSNRVAAGRVLYHSEVWSANGAHVATIMQDGMIRVTKKASASTEEIEMVREREGKWVSRGKL